MTSLSLTKVARSARRVPRGLRAVLRLHRAGLFDPAWYRLQEPSAPRWRVAALAHFLLRAATRDVSPHPLVEPSWVDHGRARRGAPALAPLLIFVRLLGTARERPGHPLFDPAAWAARHPSSRTHPGGALGHFVATASPDTPLPLPADLLATGMPAPTLAEVLAAARAALTARTAAEVLRRAPRWQPSFDQAGSRRTVAEAAGWDLPAPDPARPLVSVVTPVRDRQHLIGAAIASVQAQTLTDWELVVVDDGSHDDSAAVVAAAAAADPRVRLVQGRGEGVSRARNLAAAHARGRYVAWLDSDNAWTPDHLRTLVATMHARGLRAAYSVVEAHGAGGSVRYRALGAPDREATLALLRVANHVDLNALVVEVALLEEVGGFDETLRRTVDYDLVWRMAERTQIALVPFVGVRYRDVPDPSRITTAEDPAWREVVKARRDLDWARLTREAPSRPDGVAVLVVATGGWRPALSTALGALTLPATGGSGRAAEEVVVVDDAQDRATASVLAALALHPRVRVLRAPRAEGVPLGLARALAASHSRHVLAVAEGLAPWPGTPGLLAAALGDAPQDGGVGGAVAAVPVVLDATGTVVSAGTVSAPSGAGRLALFSGLAPEDAARAGAVLPVDGVAPGACLWWAADVVAVGGPDPLAAEAVEADLTGRIARHRGERAEGPLVVAVTGAVVGPPWPVVGPKPRAAAADPVARRSRITPVPLVPGAASPQPEPGPAGGSAGTDAWAAAGFEPVALEDGGWGVRRLRARVQQSPPSLRWAIKTATPVGPAGWHWGDTHFARALAAALEALGQDVVVDSRATPRRPGEVHDDVVLVLRGLERVVPPEDAVALLWLISHPEQVDAEELAAYDDVFAASLTWAEAATARGWGPAGRGVRALLQATDAARFRPDAAPRDSGEQVLFVGNSRSQRRPVVHDLLAAGVDVALYGRWDGLVDPRLVRARFLPNDQVPAAYAGAGVVLNDHWPDMRELGFVSNRLFDAAACGARVISDRVAGVEELFGGLVRTFDSTGELLALVAQAPHGWPEEPQRTQLAERVRAEHSFGARAATLLEAAAQAHARRQAGGS
ncbi:MAG: glycosyltransferase [Kineosporiaceae bacterium]